MSFFELDCACGGYTSHTIECPKRRATTQAKPVPASPRDASQFRYRGRVYRIVIQARSPDGPVTLETIDEPRETINTTNDRLVQSEFEPVLQ